MQPEQIATWSEMVPMQPTAALVAGVDLVIVRWPDAESVSVLYGRCAHRGAHLADGYVRGENLVCGVHNWDYRYRTGVSEYHNDERLHRFHAWIEDDGVWVDGDEILLWVKDNPQPYNRDDYQGAYQDAHGTPDEPYVSEIRELAGRPHSDRPPRRRGCDGSGPP